ncbi:MAG: hypothetical protein ACYC0M_13830, partial [Burkholderiales bacterium]
ALKITAMQLVGAHYADFGPTLAAEKLAERHQIRLSVESTRQLRMPMGSPMGSDLTFQHRWGQISHSSRC